MESGRQWLKTQRAVERKSDRGKNVHFRLECRRRDKVICKYLEGSFLDGSKVFICHV